MKTLSIRALAHVEGKASDIERLMSALTVANKYTNKIYPLYESDPKSKKRLYIPRALVKGEVEDAGWESLGNIQNKIKLRPTQKDMVDEWMAYLKEENPKGAILMSGTGTGKTVMGLEAILRLGKKALVVVPSDRIFRQWIDQIKKFTDIKRVGIIRASVCEVDAPITVAMLHTLCKDRFSHIHNTFGTILFDEVHTISTEHFMPVASKFWCKTRLGLSATPRRKDGMQNVFFWHIGKVAIRYSKVNTKPKIVTVEYYDPLTHHRGCMSRAGDLILGKYYNKLASNQRRNKVLAGLVKSAYKRDHDILVLSERIRHLHTLASMSQVPPQHRGFLTGSVKEIDRQVIFGTYGSAGLGLDIPRLSCIIFAIPRADIVQPAGRVLRSKAKTPIIIDIVDVASDIMKGWYKKRRKYYETITDDFVRLGAGYE